MKKYDLHYDYDIKVDALGAVIKYNYKYSHSVESNKVIFDLNISGEIIGLEILDASEKFKIEKEQLLNPKIEVMISTTEELIKIYIIFDFENNERRFLKEKIINENNAPIGIKQLNYRWKHIINWGC